MMKVHYLLQYLLPPLRNDKDEDVSLHNHHNYYSEVSPITISLEDCDIDTSPPYGRPRSRGDKPLRVSLYKAKPISELLGSIPIQTEKDVELKYELLECLGEYVVCLRKYLIVLLSGATASVRRARNKLTDEYVAIKIIPVEKLKFNTITREVNILKNLDHPNIVKLLDVILTPSFLYIVMELYVTCLLLMVQGIWQTTF